MALIDLRQVKDGLKIKQDLASTQQEVTKLKETTIPGEVAKLQASIEEKASQTALDSAVETINEELAKKATTEHVTQQLAEKASTQYVNEELNKKANKSHTHLATEITEDETHKFVTDAEKAKWNNHVENVEIENDKLKVTKGGRPVSTKLMTTYTSAVPSTVAVGGIEKGFTAADGVNVEELLFKLLHQYVAPRADVTVNPNGGMYEKGATVETARVTATGYREADKITQVKILVNGEEAAKKDNTSEEGNVVLTHNIEAIKTNTSVRVEVKDGKQTVSANGPSFTFVHPIYCGKLPAEAGNPSQEQIKGLTKKIVNVSQQSVNYTVNNERMVIAVPSNWTLKSAMDPNNFDMTASFNVVNVEVTCLDESTEQYKVYISNPTNQTNFTVRFNF
jgi:hypothetical protein